MGSTRRAAHTVAALGAVAVTILTIS